MTYKTHIVFAASVALPPVLYLYAQHQISMEELTLFLASLSVGATLPDIDHSKSYISRRVPILPQIIALYTKHRGFTHSIYGILTVLIILIALKKFLHLQPALFAGFISGYILHILGDSFSVSGIRNFCCGQKLAPLPSFLRYKTGSTSEEIYFFLFFLMVSFELAFFLDPAIQKKLLQLLLNGLSYLERQNF